MKRGLFIILFVIAILFISGLQSCQPTISVGNPNSCCKLSSDTNTNCINDISPTECDNLNILYGSYYNQEVWQNGLANSCNSVSGCLTSLSCKYQDDIYENGEKVCLEENSKIYQCSNGKWIVSNDCSSGPIIGCENIQTCFNPAIITPNTQCSNGDCGYCTPYCFYANACSNTGTDSSGCGATCARNTDGVDCSTGDCAQCVSSPPGPVLLYHFNNQPNFGETVNYIHDFSGNGGIGTLTDAFNFICGAGGCPTWVPDGKFGGAYSFDGQGDYINTPDNYGYLTLSNDVSISAWIYWPSSGVIVAKRDGSPTGINYQFSILSGGIIQFCAPTCFYSLAHSIANKWIHIVVIRNGANVYIYEDGVLIAQGTFANAMQPVGSTLTIGAAYAAGGMTSFFNGKMDELAIWDRALTSTEVSNLYQSSLPVCGLCTTAFCSNQQCIPQ